MISVAYHTARLNVSISKNRHISATNQATASKKRSLESSLRELSDSEFHRRFRTALVVEKWKNILFAERKSSVFRANPISAICRLN